MLPENGMNFQDLTSSVAIDVGEMDARTGAPIAWVRAILFPFLLESSATTTKSNSPFKAPSKNCTTCLLSGGT